MSLGWVAEVPMLLVGGFAAGLVNTLASSGSAISLPLLVRAHPYTAPGHAR